MLYIRWDKRKFPYLATLSHRSPNLTTTVPRCAPQAAGGPASTVIVAGAPAQGSTVASADAAVAAVATLGGGAAASACAAPAGSAAAVGDAEVPGAHWLPTVRGPMAAVQGSAAADFKSTRWIGRVQCAIRRWGLRVRRGCRRIELQGSPAHERSCWGREPLQRRQQGRPGAALFRVDCGA